MEGNAAQPLPASFGRQPAGPTYRRAEKRHEAEITLKPGPHTLQLLFGDKDHVPHSPPVLSHRIRVVVAEPQPREQLFHRTRKYKRTKRGTR